MSAAALLPLNSKGRWVGLILFMWSGSYLFDERDQRIYTALIQQAAPVIDSVRLYEQAQRRAHELESAKNETDLLYAASNKMAQASTPDELLGAVSDFARSNGAICGELLYFYGDEKIPLQSSELVAEWALEERALLGVGRRFSDFGKDYASSEGWAAEPDFPMLVEDAQHNTMFLEAIREDWIQRGIISCVILPLKKHERWVGMLIFGWATAYCFNERDQRIYTALIRQATSVIDSARLFEQIQRRAHELESAKNETDLLYEASHKLAEASTPAELLEAVSDFARSTNATYGQLIYFYGDDSEPLLWGELVAEWAAERRTLLGVGRRFSGYGMDYASTKGWAAQPDRPMLVENAQQNMLFHEDVRSGWMTRGIVSCAVLPLKTHERWVGMLFFGWGKDYTFTERDQRIYTAIIRQATRVIDAVRLFEQSRERAARAERLLKVNTALSQATDEAQILKAVALYTESQRADALVLTYLNVDAQDQGATSWPVAMWKDGDAWLYDEGRQRVVNMTNFGIADLWITEPKKVLLIENIATDERIAQENREEMLASLKMRAFAIVPLYSGGRYHGVMSILWFEPHPYCEEIYIYTQLMQTLPSVVATRRAYLAEEEARQENEFLYRVGEAINAAMSFQEIVQAVANLDVGADAVILTAWENYNFDTAAYLEVLATIRHPNGKTPESGRRVPASNFPITSVMPRDEVWVIENTQSDPRVDERSAATWGAMSTVALIGTPLYMNNRFMGGLTFHSSQPRKYTERERRLTAGIGDLVLAAFERIRLQMETENSRRHAEMLAQINAALSQAADETAILEAVARLAESFGAALSSLAYLVAVEQGLLRKINIVALRSGDGRSPLPASLLPITSFDADEYPLLQLAFAYHEEALFIENLLTDLRTEPGNMREFSRSVNWAAAIMIPLKTGEQWQGILTFVWKEPQTFTPDMRMLFNAIQPATASVVASRRAYVAEQQRAHQLETVAKVSAAASSILDEGELLDTVSELARISFKNYHFVIYLLDEKGEHLIQTTGAVDAYNQPVRLPYRRISLSSERSLVAQAGRTRQGVIVNDITNSDEYSLTPMLPEARSEMAVPMVVVDRLIGVLDVQTREVNHFTEADIWVMATLADLIAVAIENARLYKRGQELAALEERTRLARELHDSVSQALYGIALGARTARTLLERDPSRLAEPLDYVMALAEAGLTEMRALIFDLRPESLQNEGLTTALAKQAASLQARHGIQVETHLCDEPMLPLEVKETLYRIAREALHNTVKHAQASHILLCMRCQDDAIALEVKDNGHGFDPAGDFPGHLGLQSMRERTARLNGSFEITSAPGEGTRVFVQIGLPLALL